jgi:hypothetical protein
MTAFSKETERKRFRGKECASIFTDFSSHNYVLYYASRNLSREKKHYCHKCGKKLA